MNYTQMHKSYDTTYRNMSILIFNINMTFLENHDCFRGVRIWYVCLFHDAPHNYDSAVMRYFSSNENQRRVHGGKQHWQLQL